MDDLKIKKLKQLRDYANWEKQYNPTPPKKIHILDWAADELERLYKENEKINKNVED